MPTEEISWRCTICQNAYTTVAEAQECEKEHKKASGKYLVIDAILGGDMYKHVASFLDVHVEGYGHYRYEVSHKILAVDPKFAALAQAPPVEWWQTPPAVSGIYWAIEDIGCEPELVLVFWHREQLCGRNTESSMPLPLKCWGFWHPENVDQTESPPLTSMVQP